MAITFPQLFSNTDITVEIISNLGLKEAVKFCAVSQLFNKIISSDYFLSRIAPSIFNLKDAGIKDRINTHAVTSKTAVNELFKKLLKECGAFGSLRFTVHFPNNINYQIVITNKKETENTPINAKNYCVYMDALQEPKRDFWSAYERNLGGAEFHAYINAPCISYMTGRAEYGSPIISEICNEADLAIRAIQPEFEKQKREAFFKMLMSFIIHMLIIGIISEKIKRLVF